MVDRSVLYKLLFPVLLGFSFLPVTAQVKPGPGDIKGLLSAVNTYRSKMPVEKLYLHQDKSYYNKADTLWFKAYLLEGPFLTASTESGFFYLELANDNNDVIKRMVFPLKYGLGWGNIALDEDEFSEGNYTLRAYTSWMRNWGNDYVFTSHFSVNAPSTKSWLVNLQAHVSKEGGKDNMNLALKFSNLNKESLGLQEMQMSVMEGKKVLFRNKVTTTANGTLNTSFILPQKVDPGSLSIVAQDLSKGGSNQKITIPVQINRQENTDLQFMPEGGDLISGIPSRVGFKAITEDGKGIEATGKIYDSKQQEITSFKSLYKGMGTFELRPQPNESYTAKLTLSDGTTKSYPLPLVKSSGISLRVNNPVEDDSIEVTLSATPDIQHSTTLYYLIGHAKGVVCYVKKVILKASETTNKIDKGIFPSGICRFTLMTADYKPLNERIFYINQQDNLKISLTTNKPSYVSRDSIALNLQVTDKEGKPVQGSFSMAVTDDTQVKLDSINTNTIATYMLLTSDLKGTLEEPNYYLQNTAQAQQALDNLMLTQGWIAYDWSQVFNPKIPAFKAEPEFTITGKAMNLLKGISNTKVMLYSKSPFLLKDTLTNKEGFFTFKNLPLADTASFLVQAFNKNGKSFAVDLTVDEFKAPVFEPVNDQRLPWYVNGGSSLIKNSQNNVTRQLEQQKIPAGTNLLNEVKITATRTVRGSRNLNGSGNADQVFDEEAMRKSGKITLFQLLNKQVKGFKSGIWPSKKGKFNFLINGNLAKLVIDGVDVDDYYYPFKEEETINEHFQFVKDYLDNYTAEDIIGIEIMYSMQYSSAYNGKFLGTEDHINSGLNAGKDYAYIEVTTRSGKGPFKKKTPSVYLYKPLPFTRPTQFYRPRYAVKDKIPLTDLRSTLHWEPNIVTDASGKAKVSFYAADGPATYSITVEGTDMNGKIGAAIQKAEIKVSSSH